MMPDSGCSGLCVLLRLCQDLDGLQHAPLCSAEPRGRRAHGPSLQETLHRQQLVLLPHTLGQILRQVLGGRSIWQSYEKQPTYTLWPDILAAGR